MIYTTLITVSELHNLLLNRKISKSVPEFLILNCRCSIADPSLGTKEYAVGHIPDAVLCDFDKLVTGEVSHGTGRHPMPDRQTFKEHMESLGVSDDKQIIVYDQGGLGFATRLWYELRWLGLEKVAVLDGGFKAWVNAKYPISSVPVQPKPATIADLPALETPVPMSIIQDNVTSRENILLDARPEKRFHGIGETIDHKAGHIPGSISRPGSENFNPGGTFKSPVELRKEFAKILNFRNPAEVIHTCGSGVNATVNLFAMDLAGYVGSRLYAGSWSQWIDDENNPIEET